MAVFEIDIDDVDAIDRIILTACGMSFYPKHEIQGKVIPNEDAKEILKRLLKDAPDDSVLTVCDLGKYTLKVSAGEYIFYATLEAI